MAYHCPPLEELESVRNSPGTPACFADAFSSELSWCQNGQPVGAIVRLTEMFVINATERHCYPVQRDCSGFSTVSACWKDPVADKHSGLGRSYCCCRICYFYFSCCWCGYLSNRCALRSTTTAMDSAVSALETGCLPDWLLICFGVCCCCC